MGNEWCLLPRLSTDLGSLWAALINLSLIWDIQSKKGRLAAKTIRSVLAEGATRRWGLQLRHPKPLLC